MGDLAHLCFIEQARPLFQVLLWYLKHLKVKFQMVSFQVYTVMPINPLEDQ